MLHISLNQKVLGAGRSMLHVDKEARPIPVLDLRENGAPSRILKGREIRAMGQPPSRTGGSRQKAKMTHDERPKGGHSHPYVIAFRYREIYPARYLS